MHAKEREREKRFQASVHFGLAIVSDTVAIHTFHIMDEERPFSARFKEKRNDLKSGPVYTMVKV